MTETTRQDSKGRWYRMTHENGSDEYQVKYPHDTIVGLVGRRSGGRAWAAWSGETIISWTGTRQQAVEALLDAYNRTTEERHEDAKGLNILSELSGQERAEAVEQLRRKYTAAKREVGDKGLTKDEEEPDAYEEARSRQTGASVEQLREEQEEADATSADRPQRVMIEIDLAGAAYDNYWPGEVKWQLMRLAPAIEGLELGGLDRRWRKLMDSNGNETGEIRIERRTRGVTEAPVLALERVKKALAGMKPEFEATEGIPKARRAGYARGFADARAMIQAYLQLEIQRGQGGQGGAR